MNFLESIQLAFGSIRQYKLRAFLTLLSISIGVFAIMGVGTLVSSLENSISKELEALGDNSFVIKKFPPIMTDNSWRKYYKRKAITYKQVEELKDKLEIVTKISAVSQAGGLTVKSNTESSDPDVSLIGCNEDYFSMSSQNIIQGRIITDSDIDYNRNVAIIGNDVIVKIFPHTNPLGKQIKIGNQSFTVVGILEEKGAIMGQSQDNKVIIPITNFLRSYANRWNESLSLILKAPSKQALIPAMDEAIGVMRGIRNVKPWEDNDFEIETNDDIIKQFESFTVYLFYFGYGAGIIALLAAGVGIMNIMLVSVKERTKEIGLRKAIGARRSWIILQFIIETITLTQIGGAIGILLGFIAGAVLTAAFKLDIIFSISGFVWSVGICTLIGLIFGAYPAWKAAKLDPIEALRYE